MASLSEPSSDADPLVGLAEEYAERYRRGERPDLTEYTDKYPALAARIRQLFPAMVVIEEFGSVAGPSTDPHSAAGASAPPRQLGEYRILREVGRGGMGVVYEAVQESLGRHVALKVVAAQTWKNPTHLERFRREARAVARLHHTNIVPVFGVGEAEGVHYYAMQFIQGQSLDSVLHELKRLRRARSARPAESTEDAPANGHHHHSLSASIAQGLVSGHFPDEGVTPRDGKAMSDPPTGPRTTPPFTSWGGDGRAESRGPASADGAGRSELTSQPDAQYFRGVARIGVQAAEALAYAHSQGILHRDVKPGNLLLDTQGMIWVTDFGLAKAEDSAELTTAGDIVGTVRYMAPERFQGHADPRSDVYALGLTLYEMLTLRPAFDSTDRARLIDRITRETPPAPRKLDPRIPRDLETVVLKAIAREPGARYPTAAALAEDLGRFLADRPIRARRISWAGHTWRWCRRNPAVAGLLTAVAGLLVVTVAVLAVSNARIRGALDQEKRANDKLEQTLYYQWIAAAADARGKGRAARAEELLDRCPPHLRGLEWHYLKRLPFASLPPLEHDDNIILRMVYSPDGGRLAVGTRAGTVTVWNVRTGEAIFGPCQAQKSFLRGLAFSPDGQFLATGGEDDRVRLWDLQTRKLNPPREFPIGHQVILVALVFNGRQLAVSTQDRDRNIRVWDIDAGTETVLDSRQPLAIGGLAFSADGPELLAVSTEGVVTAWDVTTGTPTVLIDADLPGVHGAVIDPVRRLIALGSEHGTVKVIRADPWRVEWELEAHTGPIHNLAFGFGGDRLAICAADMTIRLWDMRTGREALGIDFPRYRWNSLAFSPDGHRLAAGSISADVLILDGTPLDGPGDAGQVRTLAGHRHTVAWLAYSPAGGRIASASWDGTVKVWDARSDREPRTLSAGEIPLTGVAFSHDGRLVAASSSDGTVHVWDADTGRPLYPPLRAQAGPVYGVAFTPDGRALASAHHDGTVHVWDAGTGAARYPPLKAHGNPVLGLAFSRDGQFLVTAGGKGHSSAVWKWGAESEGPVLVLVRSRGILRNPVCSPDGRRVAAVTSGLRVVWVWDTTPGGEKEREAKELVIPGAGRVHQAVFHPDGRRLIVAADEGVYLLDPDTGAATPAPVAHAGDVRCAALSPDGQFLATGAGYGDHGEVRIWDVARLR